MDGKKHPIVTGPEAPCILGIDYLRNGYFKDPKGYRWAFGIAAVETEDIRQLSTLPGLSDDSCAVGLLRVEEQQYQSPQQQYTKTDGNTAPTETLRVQGPVCLHLEGVQYTWNRLPQGWKHSPTICHGLIQTALEKGEAPEHLQYIDDIIVWGNTAGEVFEKGEKIIQILLKAGFAIKRSKVKGPAQEIQFLGVKWQDGRRQIPTEVINKIIAMSPTDQQEGDTSFPRRYRILEDAHS
ncbi:hypothetical protein DUI87_04139 [Hirundo rustica rustica]|uniref:ribonuclease H n=1 Tax=Hirundo rustica rustica TaxID=333673 RepID=A0A3M0LGQ4_HIRRU|nr:hypothetical protein DUI87_04139 [Hirundo rustica rustica]